MFDKRFNDNWHGNASILQGYSVGLLVSLLPTLFLITKYHSELSWWMLGGIVVGVLATVGAGIGIRDYLVDVYSDKGSNPWLTSLVNLSPVPYYIALGYMYDPIVSYIVLPQLVFLVIAYNLVIHYWEEKANLDLKKSLQSQVEEAQGKAIDALEDLNETKVELRDTLVRELACKTEMSKLYQSQVEMLEEMEAKSLDVTDTKDAEAKVSDVKIVGDPDQFELLAKASSESQGWMKSFKRAKVPGGDLYQVTTQQRNPDGSYAVAEALAFSPYSNK